MGPCPESPPLQLGHPFGKTGPGQQGTERRRDYPCRDTCSAMSRDSSEVKRESLQQRRPNTIRSKYLRQNHTQLPQPADCVCGRSLHPSPCHTSDRHGSETSCRQAAGRDDRELPSGPTAPTAEGKLHAESCSQPADKQAAEGFETSLELKDGGLLFKTRESGRSRCGPRAAGRRPSGGLRNCLL
jgi:hypothetical protein